MISMLILSCGGDDSTNDNTGATENNADITDESFGKSETSDSASSVESRPDYTLSEEDFNGYNFRILSRTPGGWGNHEISAEEITGDPINDSVYQRNGAIEEKYNVIITNIPSDDVSGAASRSIRAGSDDYDLLIVGLVRQEPLITSGLLNALNDVPYVDLTKPWWDQRAVEQLAINNKLFTGVCDFTIIDKDSIAIFMFSKQLMQEYELENPYELVSSGQWTLDKMFDMMRTVSRDLNGDGIIDDEDQFGLTTAVHYSQFLFNAAGESIAKLNADKIPEITLFSERAVAVTDKIREIQSNTEYTINVDSGAFDSKYGNIWIDLQQNMFTENRALFFHGRMQSVTALREMETDFGILPPPKFDEYQANYHAAVGTWTASAVSVPITVPDLEVTGLILEALVFESRYTLLPAYYDINLKTKFARDEESKEMIDIILQNRIYDLGEMYSWGDVSAYFTDLSRGNTTSLMTFWERNETRIEAAMQRTLDRLN